MKTYGNGPPADPPQHMEISICFVVFFLKASLSKNNNIKLANGHVKNGVVKTGILKTSRKTSDADSDVAASVSHKSSVSSNSSVTFASEIQSPEMEVHGMRKCSSLKQKSTSPITIIRRK